MLEIIAFCCGALVMVLEMVGARVLAPHVGTSAVVWTSLIGVVLACLAVGAWLGGRLADRHLSRRGLAFILTGAALGSALAAGTHRLVGEALSAAITDIHLAAVACALGILALPALCCGMISPYIIRLRIRDVATSGATVGRLYALSTAGSIVGTFLGGFVLISFFASGTILWGVALGLLLLSLPAQPSRPWWRLGLLLVLLLLAIWDRQFRPADGPLMVESPYNCMLIHESRDRGRPVRILSPTTASPACIWTILTSSTSTTPAFMPWPCWLVRRPGTSLCWAGAAAPCPSGCCPARAGWTPPVCA